MTESEKIEEQIQRIRQMKADTYWSIRSVLLAFASGLYMGWAIWGGK